VSYPFETIAELIAQGRPDHPAIAAPGRPALSYAGLQGLARRTTQSLNRVGIGRGDRIAIVLPNGPEMATAFIAVAAGATSAPLNPAYRADEFDFYLGDLNAKALLILRGFDSPARAMAAQRQVPVIELVPVEDGAAGDFTLDTGDLPMAPPAQGGMATADEVALVLHTSGTTSRPKIVPLRQRNIAASAHHIRESLALVHSDVCLNIMPLFHIHGLIAAVLSSLAGGASVSCTPGFNALKFFGWFDQVQPSWYTAVPTMHQAILARAERNKDEVARSRLRLVRSSSASLPPQVMEELEATFGAPVIEAYGMTEAAHQMASNPLPPRRRFPGSVGIAAGPEIAIMTEDGTLLPSGDLGEIVIRGPNVTDGYEANPEANAKGFTDGWFRTGDQGYLDEDGYLRLTGRLKELINRGGEKISPLEVDTILMDHPAVAQVATFAVKHDKLGEEVAAAVVLRSGMSVDERTLRDFVAERLADFKVPRKILFMAEIPKGPTGKLQRIGLAKQLGLEA